MTAFHVTRERIVPVVTYRREVEVVYEGDDWLDAEDAHHAAVMDRSDGRVRFEGHHPSHDIEIPGTRCVACGAPDNGCFKVHAPCGYEMGGRAIITIKADERAARS